MQALSKQNDRWIDGMLVFVVLVRTLNRVSKSVRKNYVTRTLCTRVDTDAINHATTYATVTAKISYCDQIKFNEPVLKPGTPE